MQPFDPVTPESEPFVRAELARLLTSPEFEGADRMSDLLRHVVTSSLEGRVDHLKESVIGVQLFGRQVGYDTKLDPVVRVSAGRLRQRIQKYYERTGTPEAVRIDIPKGTYVPRFEVIRQEIAPVEPGALPEPPPAVEPRRPAWVLFGLLVLPLIAVGAYFLRHESGVPLASLVNDARPFTHTSGTVLRPSFSPDGQTVAYDWHAPGDSNRHIWLQRIDTDAPVRFTDGPDYEFWPVWSPDGGTIAFVRRGEPGQSKLILKSTLGGSERHLATIAAFEHDHPKIDWQPNGNWIAVAERKSPRTISRLMLIDAKTGDTRYLTKPPADADGDSEPAFSPDGREVAFRRTISSGIEDVFVVSINGGEPRRVTKDNRGVPGLIWRRDGRALVVASRRAGSLRQLWEFPLNGGEPVRLTPAAMDAGSPALSRDGHALLFVQSFEDKNIYSMSIDRPGSAERLIASIAADTDPVISPDGRSLLFRSNRTGADEIWIADINGANERRLTRMQGPVTGAPKWSGDASMVFFDSRPHGKPDVFVIPAQGGEPRSLTPRDTPEGTPFPSPDGKWIYFVTNRSGAPDVWRQPYPEGPMEQVTSGGGASPKLSPDGKTLFYTRNVNGAGLFELPLHSTLPAEGKRLADLNNLLLGHWTVARSGIYFVEIKEKPYTVLKHFDFRTRQITQRCDLPGRASFYDGGLAVSPDEKTVYFSALDRTGSNLVLGRR
jgi:Tol biopolymer transport system component